MMNPIEFLSQDYAVRIIYGNIGGVCRNYKQSLELNRHTVFFYGKPSLLHSCALRKSIIEIILVFQRNPTCVVTIHNFEFLYFEESIIGTFCILRKFIFLYIFLYIFCENHQYCKHKTDDNKWNSEVPVFDYYVLNVDI